MRGGLCPGWAEGHSSRVKGRGHPPRRVGSMNTSWPHQEINQTFVSRWSTRRYELLESKAILILTLNTWASFRGFRAGFTSKNPQEIKEGEICFERSKFELLAIGDILLLGSCCCAMVSGMWMKHSSKLGQHVIDKPSHIHTYVTSTDPCAPGG